MGSPLDSVHEPNARRRLEAYLDSLERWSRTINLTGARTRDGMITTLIEPVLGAEAWLEGRVIDVGSGNGSPGLVLASLRTDLAFVLLEPRAKRWAFLRDAIRQMGLQNVEPVRARSDAYRGTQGRTVVLRAVGLDP